jgi:DNA-binding response OmpR family regulator
MAKIRILLVEDRPSYSKMLLKRLDDPVQYKVELRTEPDGAVQLARSESFDLILIDLHLKNDSGHCSRLRVRREVLRG